MSSMCARNGQEIPHTRVPLLFIAHLKIPTLCATSTDFAHTRTVRALRPDGPPYK
jgi:hypothetical protein